VPVSVIATLPSVIFPPATVEKWPPLQFSHRMNWTHRSWRNASISRGSCQFAPARMQSVAARAHKRLSATKASRAGPD
jgi:hypothetical protein